MIGPSSSHTAGAVRIGRIALKILGEDAATAEIGLSGSFAKTYKGHGTDKAIIAGILGMKPDDERIPNSLQLAKEAQLKYNFSHTEIKNAHPNTAVIDLTGVKGAKCTVEGVSVGGGNIQITKLNGMKAAFNGTYNTLIIAHNDRPGVIAAVTEKLAQFNINIGSFRLSRSNKNELAIMTIELDSGVDKPLVSELRELENISSVVYMRPMT